MPKITCFKHDFTPMATMALKLLQEQKMMIEEQMKMMEEKKKTTLDVSTQWESLNKETVSCPFCDIEVLRENLRRHLDNKHPK